MSRRRKNAAWPMVRFRVVCSCTEPPVEVMGYRALADPEARQRQLDQAEEPGAFGRLRVLHPVRPGAAIEYGLDVDPYSGNDARNKPTEWRCPKCHRTVSPTAQQADRVADQQLRHGVDSIDLFRLSAIISG